MQASTAQIVETTGFSKVTVLKHTKQEYDDDIEEFKFESPIKEKRGGGRPKIYGEETVRRIVTFAEENRKMGARKIEKLDDINSTGLSHNTINRILNDNGLKARRKLKKTKMSPQNINDRFVFARRHRNWTV